MLFAACSVQQRDAVCPGRKVAVCQLAQMAPACPEQLTQLAGPRVCLRLLPGIVHVAACVLCTAFEETRKVHFRALSSGCDP